MGAAAGHSPIGPSGAKVWTECTSSVGYIAANEALLPPDDSSKYSVEGEKAHEVAATCLRGRTLTCTLHPYEDVSHYLAVCNARLKESLSGFGPYAEFIERDVPLFYSPSENGTIDYGVASNNFVGIVDLKWGAGVYVEERENLQLAIYARSVVRMLSEDGHVFVDDENVVISMTIVQPRCLRAGKPMAREWRITLSELRDFTLRISDAVLAIKTNDLSALKFAPSESNCQFCRARHLPCEAMRKAALAGLPVRARALKTKEDLERLLPDLDVLSGTSGAVPSGDLVEIFRAAPLIRSYLSAVEDALRRRALEAPVGGIKWVAGREGNREWVDEEATRAVLEPLLKAEIYVRKLLSPTQMEPLLKKKVTKAEFKPLFDPLIRREPAKPVLAVSEDPRPALPIATPADLSEAHTSGKLGRLPVLTLSPISPADMEAAAAMTNSIFTTARQMKQEIYREAYERIMQEERTHLLRPSVLGH